MRLIIVIALSLAGSVAIPGILLSQDAVLQVAARGPQFFYAPAPSAAPVRLDVKRTDVLMRRITLDLQNVTLDAALTTITRESGLRLIYSRAVLPLDKRVSIKAEGITVGGAIGEVLVDLDVDVLFNRYGQAMVVPRNQTPTEAFPAGAVVGKFTDAAGLPVSGASVSIEGTTIGAQSRDDGTYRIAQVPPGTHTLVARRIGYLPARRTATAGSRHGRSTR